MCGIVGYIGKEIPVSDFLFEGLEKLEYRGYDSAGIAVSQNGALVIEKREGKLSRLKKHLNGRKFTGSIGLGHTRWATHGRPSETNAHPHTDASKKIAVVHNGIIENYQALKSELIQKGDRFASETDTEVIAHLIADERKNGSVPLEEAVRRSLKRARGAYALGVISSDEPGKLVAARLGSPLILGIGKGAFYIASDVPAILKYTDKVIYPNDGEMIVLTQGDYKIVDLENRPVKHKIHTIEWSVDQVAKNGYEKFMLKEIHEQPQVIDAILKRRVNEKNKISFEELKISEKYLKQVKRIVIVSCGTAFHAGFYIKYFIEHLTALPVEIDLASEFRYHHPKISKEVLVVTISQSGETADSLACLRMAKEKGCKVLSLVNVLGSTIDRESDGVIYTHAGPEIGVASTKAYTAQMASGILFSLYFALLRDETDSGNAGQILNDLKKIPAHMKSLFDREQDLASLAKKYAFAQSALYLGRGFNYPSALEGALKNKEISYMHAEGYAAGEMKHGPIALIDEKFPVFCICPQGDAYEKMMSNVKEVEARKGMIIAIATEGDEGIGSIARDIIFIPDTREILTPLLVAIPLQLLAYYIAESKGCDIDQPRNLAKSVTVE